jgi:hypothetical protein
MEVEIFTWKRYLAIYCEGKKIMVYIMSYDRRYINMGFRHVE